MKDAREGREILKGGDWNRWGEIQTDQRKKVPMPELQKDYPENSTKLDLVEPGAFTLGGAPFLEVVNKRRSRRSYTLDTLTLEELSYLLWTTQGVSSDNKMRRTVPSGGARHAFETYLAIQRVEGIKPGLYRYLPLEHKLLLLEEDGDLADKVTEACNYQSFAGQGAVTFIWTTLPYRCEWRYDTMAPKLIALDAGHLCQNLYLACESINLGTCAIGAYDQKKIDSLLKVDGVDEFTIYIAPVGRCL